mmetsp:Transcript_4337/g.6555  ORF Transcript_4337/g.6555 Transcript_4337/m.6555 type:complete len:109 (-) Transcript_4337:27-353(-)
MFTLLVVVKFSSKEVKEAWCESLEPLVQHVQQHEPNTLQYQFSQCIENPLLITIFETYVTKTDFEDVHLESEPFKAHIARMKKYEDAGDIVNESFLRGITLPFGYLTR